MGQRLVFPSRGNQVVVEEGEILYIERENRVTKIYLRGETLEVSLKLSEIQAYLDMHKFVRCHNSFIVNLREVRTFGHSEFCLKNEVSVPISRSKLIEVKEIFNRWVAEGCL